MSHITVIGAGISGLMSAYFLCKKGHYVTIVDEQKYSGMMCSYANGGQISVCNSETWNNPATLLKGLKWMFKADAPLLVRPWPSIRKMLWLAGFIAETVKNTHIDNTRKTIQLGVQSRNLYDLIIEEEGLEFDQRKTGMLQVFTKHEDLDHARSLRNLFMSNKCDWDIISPKSLIELEPTLTTFEGIIGGVYTESDWSGDIHKFCDEMSVLLQKKYGVEFKYGSRINDPRDIPGKVVIATGHELHTHARKLNEFLNVYPVKGYSITVDVSGYEDYAPSIPLIDNNKKIVSSRLGNRLRVAGTAELADIDYNITSRRVKPLLDWVHNNFPHIKADKYSSWACLRPMASNMMPIVRASKNYKSIYYHGGHGHLGWTLAAATGKQLADIIDE